MDGKDVNPENMEGIELKGGLRRAVSNNNRFSALYGFN